MFWNQSVVVRAPKGQFYVLFYSVLCFSFPAPAPAGASHGMNVLQIQSGITYSGDYNLRETKTANSTGHRFSIINSLPDDRILDLSELKQQQTRNEMLLKWTGLSLRGYENIEVEVENCWLRVFPTSHHNVIERESYIGLLGKGINWQIWVTENGHGIVTTKWPPFFLTIQYHELHSRIRLNRF